MREQREPSTCPPFWTPHAAPGLIGQSFRQSRSPILKRTLVDVCNWPNRFAPLESAAAPVGGEREPVSSLNCRSSEAETVFRQYFTTNVETKCQNRPFQPSRFWLNGPSDRVLAVSRLRLLGSRSRCLAAARAQLRLASQRAKAPAKLRHKGRGQPASALPPRAATVDEDGAPGAGKGRCQRRCLHFQRVLCDPERPGCADTPSFVSRRASLPSPGRVGVSAAPLLLFQG